MTPGDSGALPEEKRHRDGSLWARGFRLDGELHGAWEWFRIDGTRMRSGSFSRGVQVGEWVTYNAKGEPHRTTTFPERPSEE